MTAALSMSRRHAAGAGTARSVLLTVLGELVLPAGGAAWTSAVIDVLGRFGVEEKAARQALMRTAADGWLAAERAGRRTRWSLTDAGERLLVDGTRRIFGFTGAMQDWDGRWLLVLARVPESERATRHLLRTRLSWAALGSPAPGVWLGPHVERRAEVEEVLVEADLREDAHVFVASHAGFGEPGALVRQAWELPALAAEYASFSAAFGPRAARRPADPLTATVELVHRWRRFPAVDPELPVELLPEAWPGTAAARLFARLHRSWVDAARASFAELNAAAA